MKKFLITAIIALSAASASANDYIEHQIYSDKNFEQNRAKAVRMLEQRYKNGREYDIILSYPDLKIIRETIDY